MERREPLSSNECEEANYFSNSLEKKFIEILNDPSEQGEPVRSKPVKLTQEQRLTSFRQIFNGHFELEGRLLCAKRITAHGKSVDVKSMAGHLFMRVRELEIIEKTKNKITLRDNNNTIFTVE